MGRAQIERDNVPVAFFTGGVDKLEGDLLAVNAMPDFRPSGADRRSVLIENEVAIDETPYKRGFADGNSADEGNIAIRLLAVHWGTF
jgi:hypothetical protein